MTAPEIRGTRNNVEWKGLTEPLHPVDGAIWVAGSPNVTAIRDYLPVTAFITGDRALNVDVDWLRPTQIEGAG